MREAYVQLLCPKCTKNWSDNPDELPGPDASFTCPDCGTTSTISEFMRTSRDLEILTRLQE